MSDPIADVLGSHKVAVTAVETHRGPTTTLHTYALEPGTKVASFANLAKDMAVAVGQEEVRIHAPVKGTTLVGVEVPNEVRTFPTFAFDRVHDMPLLALAPLSFPVGVDQNNHPVISSLTKMPHLLIAGRTGAGKSVALTTIITALIAQHSPAELELTLIDPKRVELGMFADAPQVTDVVTDLDDVADRLDEIVFEMDQRYAMFEDTGDRSIDEYNVGAVDPSPPPYIVVVIDELADLMIQRKKDVEPKLIRIAQLGRAAGIHLVLATQRPTRDVITGLIKANVPSRWTFAVSSTTDSMVVLDQPGASALIGKGDSLWFPAGAPAPERVQAYLTPDAALSDVVQWAEQEWPEKPSTIIDESGREVLNPDVWQDMGYIEDDGYLSAEDAVAAHCDEELSEQLGMPVIVDPNLSGNVAVLGSFPKHRAEDIVVEYPESPEPINLAGLDGYDEQIARELGDLGDLKYFTDGSKSDPAVIARKVRQNAAYAKGEGLGYFLAPYLAVGAALGGTLFVLATIFGS